MELTTPRLRLRPLQETDWPQMQQLFISFQASPYGKFDAPLPTDTEGAKALTKKFAESGLFFSVLLKDNGEMVGYLCFHDSDGAYDLGYLFHADHHGRGYAAESAKKLMEYFADQKGVRIFTAHTALENLPSRKLLDRLGFTLVSTEQVSFDQSFCFQGGVFKLEK